ncbi:uncharacterized protein [Diabrotica undecimpunctata]|uniref:uncharacterized protein n=1 Tax=Diabrotica undecimpunctata TaxID=50387 RepID=UPI003B63F6E4
MEMKEEQIECIYTENIFAEPLTIVKSENEYENYNLSPCIEIYSTEINIKDEPQDEFDTSLFHSQGTSYQRFQQKTLSHTRNKLSSCSKEIQNKKRKLKKEYHCPVCYNNFTPRKIHQHVDIHFGKHLNICKICGKMSSRTSEFLTHYFIHRIKVKVKNKSTIKNTSNIKILLKSALRHKNHIKKSSNKVLEKKFECKNCGGLFKNKIQLKKHKCLKICSKKTRINKKCSKNRIKQPLKCKICFKKYRTKFSLSNHLKMHKLNMLTCRFCKNLFLRKNFLAHIRTHTEHGTFTCYFDYCAKIFQTQFDLENHLLCHMPIKRFKCDICYKPFMEQSQLSRHYTFHANIQNYQCTICQKDFPGKIHLDTHMYEHTGVKPFMCEFCSKEFVRIDSLKNHLKRHTNDRKFQCDVCQKRFIRRITLVEHYRIHTGEKPFKCEQCPKAFTQRSRLRIHIKVHSEEKTITCEVCEKKFLFQYQLRRHLLTHNAKKRFECEICFKQFIEKRNLNAHVLLHTGDKPYKCDLCSKSFTWKHNLSHHMKVHEEKAFQCNVCQETFSRYHILQTHYRIHTGEVPFKCDYCCKEFKQKISLTNHVTLCHPDDSS